MAIRKTPSGGAKPDKLMRDAISVELHETVKIKGKKDEIKKLRLVARALIDAAIAGDVMAMKEVNDRMDGRATQRIEAHVDLIDRLSVEDQTALAGVLEALAGSASPAEEGTDETHH